MMCLRAVLLRLMQVFREVYEYNEYNFPPTEHLYSGVWNLLFSCRGRRTDSKTMTRVQ